MKRNDSKTAPAAEGSAQRAEPGTAESVRSAAARKAGADKADVYPGLRRRAMFRERHPDEPE